MAIIDAHGLTYTYPNAPKPAVQDVTLHIDKGDFVILTGPSGCGKTTLCRCFNGLIPHFYQGTLTGAIRVVDRTVADHPIHELATHVGLVFQNPENQLFALSVEKDVAFGLENLGVPRHEMQERVTWALDTVGIRDLRDRSPTELSGGQQQRVAIASVIAMRPAVMVLDEPTSFLDPLSARRIFEVIQHLNRTLGITVILVEHRLDLAARYATHVIVMDKGKVVLDGNPRDALSAPQARLLGVGIPKATRLHQMLADDKVLRPHPVPVTPEELAEQLREAMHP